MRGDPSAHRGGCCQLGATSFAETLHLAVDHGAMLSQRGPMGNGPSHGKHAEAELPHHSSQT